MKRIALLFMLIEVIFPLAAGGRAEFAPSFELWEDVRPRLEGLSFDQFLEASYRELCVRTPELVTELGLDAVYGLEGKQLNNMSEEYLVETERIQQGIYNMLDSYSSESLTDGQSQSLEVVRWYIGDLIRMQEYRLLNFSVSHFVIAEPASTELFFSDVQPMANSADAERYLIRLEKVGPKMEQLADGILLRQASGVILPSLSNRWALENIYDISQSRPDDNLYYLTFKQKLAQLDLDPESQEQLLSRALEASEDSVIHGYKRLGEVLSAQRSLSGGNRGAWSLPGGDGYYLAALRHHTTSGFGPEEVHQRGFRELERIHSEMRILFEKIGIDPNQSVAKMYSELDSLSGTVPASAVLETYNLFLDNAQKLSEKLFWTKPLAGVIVKGSDSGGFYMPANMDGSRPGIFFAAEAPEKRYKMPTLTFHETVPGHHFQLALANELPISPYQKGNSFLGYVEGWALYAEGLMAEAGYYKDDPAGDLGRLQAEAYRAARLVVDTGLHYYKWDFDKAILFFVENTGFSRGYGTWEVLRYIIWPGQAAAYMTGLLSLLDLRQEYRTASGEDYDIRDFHSLILDQGAAPLEVLEKRIGGGR